MYRFPVTITDVFERKTQKHTGGAGIAATFSSDSAGWYLQIDNFHSLYVGMEKPELKPGQKMDLILIERSQNDTR